MSLLITTSDTNLIKRAFIVSRIVAVVVVTSIPGSVLAAQQSSMPSPSALAIIAERDPYLAEAIENLPSYTYRQAGNAIAGASPITTVGDWPVEIVVKPLPTPVPAARPAAVPPILPKGSSSVLVLQGEASYYSRAGCLGCNPALRMANGQTLDDNALTMAIGANLKHLVGRQARVTSLATGKSVNVRITDTGGFYQAKYGNRVADLTIATKTAIGMAGGVGQVRVEVF